jgi:hypothetical protein
VNTKELYTFKMILKTNAACLELHTHTPMPVKRKTLRFVSNDPGDCFCCCMPLLDATNFENGYSTTEELVCSAVGKERVFNSCAIVSHGSTQPSFLYMYHWLTADSFAAGSDDI